VRASFTGTQEGMTANQRSAFRSYLLRHSFAEFHQGCCVGADEEATEEVARFRPLTHIHGHPSNLKAKTSEKALRLSKTLHPARPPLDRNQAMVEVGEVLLACPKGFEEELRSGTWSTVRRARKRGLRVILFWPSGRVTEEPGRGQGTTESEAIQPPPQPN
jgi:hypothetical protein